MNCDVDKATEALEYEFWRRWSNGKVGEWAELVKEFAGWWMGQVLHQGLLQGQEPVGVAVLWGRRLVSTMSWWRLSSNPRSQHPLTPPHSTLALAALKVSLQSTVFYCWGRPLWFGRNIHFRFISSLYVLAPLTRRPDDALVSLRYRSRAITASMTDVRVVSLRLFLTHAVGCPRMRMKHWASWP